MESVKTHLQAAVDLGESIVDRFPTACQTEYMKKLELRFGYSRAYFFLIFALVVFFVLLFVGGTQLIANLAGFLYPASASFKAIDSPDVLASTQWLSYWTIFGAFATAETVLGSLVSIIPFYHVLKLAALVYCFNPQTKGATRLYRSVIHPRIIDHFLFAEPVSSKRSKMKGSKSAAGGVGGVGKGASAGSAAVMGSGDWKDTELNELRVTVVSANNIVPTHIGQAVDCDPYCVLEVLPEGSRPKKGMAEGTKYKTVCKTGTADPVWNEAVTIPNVAQLDAKLVVTVCNKRAMGRDQCLGKIEVPLSGENLRRSGPPPDIVMALQDAEVAGEQGIGGDLHLRVQLK